MIGGVYSTATSRGWDAAGKKKPAAGEAADGRDQVGEARTYQFVVVIVELSLHNRTYKKDRERKKLDKRLFFFLGASEREVEAEVVVAVAVVEKREKASGLRDWGYQKVASYLGSRS